MKKKDLLWIIPGLVFCIFGAYQDYQKLQEQEKIKLKFWHLIDEKRNMECIELPPAITNKYLYRRVTDLEI